MIHLHSDERIHPQRPVYCYFLDDWLYISVCFSSSGCDDHHNNHRGNPLSLRTQNRRNKRIAFPSLYWILISTVSSALTHLSHNPGQGGAEEFTVNSVPAGDHYRRRPNRHTRTAIFLNAWLLPPLPCKSIHLLILLSTNGDRKTSVRVTFWKLSERKCLEFWNN